MICNPFWPGNFPDPFVLKVRGRYYAYGTEGEMHPPAGARVFPILTSSDLAQWSAADKAMAALELSFFGYWAPEVIAHNEQFLMYYAVHTEEFVCAIRVAVADRPEGPFVDSGRDLTSHLVPWAIDPHVFRDADGQWYLYMTIEFWDNPDGFTGVGNVVDRLVDPFTLQGRLTQVTSPRQAWQLYQEKRPERGGIDWYTVEGPAVIRHRKLYYEMFSGGCYYRDNYAVSYATSDTPMGPGGMQDKSWRDWEGIEGKPLFIQGDQVHVLSPGHNSFVLGPNNTDMYIAYHVLQPDMIERRPCLDRLFWHGSLPWTLAPTYTPQPDPSLPRLRELFEEPLRLASNWFFQGGRWRISSGEAIQEDDAAVSASLRCRESLSVAWLLEVNVRYVAGAGTYGVMLEGEDGEELRVTITPGLQLTVESSASPVGPLHRISLPDTIVAQAWHQLIISLSGSVLRIQFDYLRLLEVVIAHSVRTFALLTEGCSAAFSGIALTDHFQDEFLEDAQTPGMLGWDEEHTEVSAGEGHDQVSLANWRVREGALEQASLARGEHIVLKGPPLERYEFGATLRKIDAGAQPALGLVVWQGKEEKLFIWLEQRASRWTLAVSGKLAGMARASEEVELTEAFDAFNWHTLHLVRSADGLTVSLDGREMFTLTTPASSERVGLATRNTAAAFTGVWLTGLPEG